MVQALFFCLSVQLSEKPAALVLKRGHSSSGENGTPDHGRHELQNLIIPSLSDADGAGTTSSEVHWASPDTPILGTTNQAPEVEIPRLINMILIHAQAAIVHKRDGSHENILNHFMHIKFCSVVDAIHLMDSPAILILGTFTCDHEPVSPSKFCSETGEAMATKPPA